VIILLDASPLSLATHPSGEGEARACDEWITQLTRRGVWVRVPEIADFEVRRELLRVGRIRSVRRLDALAGLVGYLPLTTATMRRAAQLWADARSRGRPTAHPHALDADVILAAQAQLLAEQEGDEVVIATTNPRHLDQFVPARRWQEIGV
jgi:hypothetical protein